MPSPIIAVDLGLPNVVAQQRHNTNGKGKSCYIPTVTNGIKNFVTGVHDSAEGQRDQHVTRAWLSGD